MIINWKPTKSNPNQTGYTVDPEPAKENKNLLYCHVKI
jgi:hypothetical protein